MTYKYRYRLDADHRLYYPLSMASFYLEKRKKDIVTQSLACMLENILEQAIFYAKNGNPEPMIEKADIPILEKALVTTRKVLEEFRNV